ncbi:MAG: PAS domain S-box protein [Deltaproteobacteria bacterium]|nr:PAS domain S-box protein [Deltaproteobacteria bacterium]
MNIHPEQTNKQNNPRVKNADILLKESEARFRRLFETAQDGIILIDANSGKITDANTFLLDMLEYTRDEILGKRLWEIGFVKDIGAARAAFTALQRTGYVRYDDLPLETKSGKIFEVEFISNVYQVGPLRVIQCNIRDVSKRKRLDQLKDDFLSTVSHEIRTPISTLKMGIDNLEASINGRFQKDEGAIFDVLKRNTERLERLVKDLLDLSRYESGKMELDLQTVNIKSLINDIIQEFQCSAERHLVYLEGVYKTDLPLFMADPDLLGRLLTNLVDNAIRFAKSKVTVRARKVDFDLEISVSNDGPKINPDQVKNIFNKFVQINRPHGDSGYQGTGLGLAICSKIIMLHGGKIRVENSEEHGVQFIFTVPCTRRISEKKNPCH